MYQAGKSAIQLIREGRITVEKLQGELKPSLPVDPTAEKSFREAEKTMAGMDAAYAEEKKEKEKPARKSKPRPPAKVKGGESSILRIYLDTGKSHEVLALAENDEDPLWDPRQELKLDRDFVLNIAERGIRVPVRAWKEGNTYRVVDGRQRVRAIPEANKWRKEHKLPPLVVPVDVVPHQNDIESALAAMEEGSELNEYRITSDPIVKARIISRHLDMNRTEGEIAKMLRMSVAGVEAHKVLLTLPKKIQELVRDSRMSVTTAMELAKQSPAQLVAAAEKLVALSSTGRVTGAKARAAAGDDAGPARLTAKKIVKFIAELKVAKFTGKHGEAVARGAVLALETVLDARKLERVWEKLHEAAK